MNPCATIYYSRLRGISPCLNHQQHNLRLHITRNKTKCFYYKKLLKIYVRLYTWKMVYCTHTVYGPCSGGNKNKSNFKIVHWAGKSAHSVYVNHNNLGNIEIFHTRQGFTVCNISWYVFNWKCVRSSKDQHKGSVLLVESYTLWDPEAIHEANRKCFTPFQFSLIDFPLSIFPDWKTVSAQNNLLILRFPFVFAQLNNYRREYLFWNWSLQLIWAPRRWKGHIRETFSTIASFSRCKVKTKSQTPLIIITGELRCCKEAEPRPRVDMKRK